MVKEKDANADDPSPQLELLFTEADIIARRHELEQAKEEAHKKQIEELKLRVQEMEEKKREQEREGRERLHGLFLEKQAKEEKLKACRLQQERCLQDVEESHEKEMGYYKQELSDLYTELEQGRNELLNKQRLVEEVEAHKKAGDAQKAKDELVLKQKIEQEQECLNRMTREFEDMKKKHKRDSDAKVQAFKEESDNLNNMIEDVKREIERRGHEFKKHETELLRRKEEVLARCEQDQVEREAKLGPLAAERENLLERIREVQDKVEAKRQEEVAKTQEIVRHYDDTFDENEREFDDERQAENDKIRELEYELKDKEAELQTLREHHDEQLRDLENQIGRRLKEMEDELRDQDEKNRKQLEQAVDKDRCRELEAEIHQRACELQNLETDQQAEEAILKVWLEAVSDKEKYLREEANAREGKSANRIAELEHAVNSAKLKAANEQRDCDALRNDLESKLDERRNQFEAQIREAAAQLKDLNNKICDLKKTLKEKEDACRDRGETIESRIADEVNRLQMLKNDLEQQIGPLRVKHNELRRAIAEEEEKHQTQLKILTMEQQNQSKEQEEELRKLYALLESLRAQFKEEREQLQKTLKEILDANDKLREKHEKEILELHMRLVETLQSTSPDKIDPNAARDLLNNLKQLQDDYARKSRQYDDAIFRHAEERQEVHRRNEGEVRQLKNEIKRLSQDYLKDGIKNPTERVKKLREMVERKHYEIEKAGGHAGTADQARIMDEFDAAKSKNEELKEQLHRKKKEMNSLMNQRQTEIEELTKQVHKQTAEMSREPSDGGTLKDRLDKLSKIRTLIDKEQDERQKLLQDISEIPSAGEVEPARGTPIFENIHIETDVILAPGGKIQSGTKGTIQQCVLDKEEHGNKSEESEKGTNEASGNIEEEKEEESESSADATSTSDHPTEEQSSATQEEVQVEASGGKIQSGTKGIIQKCVLDEEEHVKQQSAASMSEGKIQSGKTQSGTKGTIQKCVLDKEEHGNKSKGSEERTNEGSRYTEEEEKEESESSADATSTSNHPTEEQSSATQEEDESDVSSNKKSQKFRTFLHKVVLCLGQREYLWILVLLLLQAVGRKKTYLEGETSDVKVSKSIKLQQVLDLCSAFPPLSQVEGLLKMLVNLKPDSQAMQQQQSSPDLRLLLRGRAIEEAREELDLLRLKMLNFATAVMSSESFRKDVAQELLPPAGEDGDDLRQRLELLVECSILNLSAYQRHASSTSMGGEDGSGSHRQRHRVAARLSSFGEKVLEASLALLPAKAFIQLLGCLLCNNQDAVRRKALEVLNAKLQHQRGGASGGGGRGGEDVFAEMLTEVDDSERLVSLLEPLTNSGLGKVVKDKQEASQETELNQQLALVALRSLGKTIGGKFPGELKSACSRLSSKKFLCGLESANVIASTLFCLPELFQALGPHAVSLLPPFISWQLELLGGRRGRGRRRLRSNPLLLSSAVLSVQKLVESFAGFLSPHLSGYVSAACRLAASFKCGGGEGRADQRKPTAESSRVRGLLSTLARSVPSHAILSVAERCYDDLVEVGGGGDEDDGEEEEIDRDLSQYAVSSLMCVVAENVSALDKARALAISGPFVDFFTRVLGHRRRLEEEVEGVAPAAIHQVEGEIIQALLALALKLSLDDFKPIFYRAFNASPDPDDLSGLSTAFHLAQASAGRLRSLFHFACESVVQRATAVLQQEGERRRKKRKGMEDDDEEEKETEHAVDDVPDIRRRRRELVFYVLGALTAAFSYNRVDSLLVARHYEEHVNSLVAVFEEEEEEKDGDERDLMGPLTDCLAQLAQATQDDSQWKYLNYQVLICLRSHRPQVRRCVLGLVRRFVESRGESYLSVLPDAVPFLCEVMEDEQPELEADCRELLRRMEEVFGQSIETYFE